MKSHGYAALALVLAVLLAAFVTGVFDQASDRRVSARPSDSDISDNLVEAAQRRAAPAPAAATRPAGQAGAPGSARIEPIIAPEPPSRDPERTPPQILPRSDSDPAALGSLVFLVRDHREIPLSGVRIALESEHGERTAFTGSVGEAVFDGLAAGPYAYRLTSDGRPELAATSLDLADGEERILELWLDDYDSGIAGRILDQRGDPVSGVTITARPYHGQVAAESLVPIGRRDTSDPDGRFEITGLGEGEYELSSPATDRYSAARTIVRAGTDGAVLSVNEIGEVQVVGQVIDLAGQPLAGVEVTEIWGQGRRTKTDAAGRYLLPIEDPGSEPRRFRFELEGFRPEELALATPSSGTEDTLRLDASLEPIDQPVSVTAILRDESGAPVAGETLNLYSRRTNMHYRGISGPDGEVVLPEVLPAPDYRLSILPKAPYRTFTWPLLDPDEERQPLEIVLQSLSTGELWGRMVDVSGQPVPYFSMWLHSDEAQGRWIQVTGDGFGNFELADVPEGRLTLQTRSRPLFRTTGIDLVAGSESYVEVVLDWGEQFIEGQVLNEQGEPIAGARIQLDWHGDWWRVDEHYSSRQTLSDSTGAFQFSGLGGGPYDLRASAAGYATKRIELPFGDDTVLFQLQASGL